MALAGSALAGCGDTNPMVTPLPHWIVARSAAFLDVIDQVRKLAAFDMTVLVEGETGVGKELVVRLLHYLSDRAANSFVPVNAGAVPDNLFENELFGHVAGAYTGAQGASPGLVELADCGTLFLDEIDSQTPHAQAALLRFLQDRSYRPVGGRDVRRANIRIVVATNANLLELTARGQLRKDLYFRLSGLRVKVPPLRERNDDIVPLAEHVLAGLNAEHPRIGKRRLGAAMRAWLVEQSWPGNVRELHSAVRRSFVMADGDEMQPPAGAVVAPLADRGFRDAKAEAIQIFERRFLDALMRENRGNISQAARTAGKERKSFDRLLRKHGIDSARYRQLDG